MIGTRGLLIRAAPVFLYASAALYVAALLYAQWRPARLLAVAGLPGLGHRVPELIGYSGFDARLGPAPPGACALIHYIAAGCESCTAEAGEFAAVARSASAKGCTVWTIAASAGGSARLLKLATVGDAPVIYLPYEWSAAVPLRATPTTILLDSAQRVTWLRVGALDAAGAPSLMRAVRGMAAH